MIWLTWRQHRIEAIVGGGLLILAIGFLLANTLSTQDMHQQVGLVTTITLLLSAFPGSDNGLYECRSLTADRPS